ncbi:MAG: hypothetical protein JWP14_381 [Frankiales bacterium]|nr:hypothetical protein [Frankiales bacterium]
MLSAATFLSWLAPNVASMSAKRYEPRYTIVLPDRPPAMTPAVARALLDILFPEPASLDQDREVHVQSACDSHEAEEASR